MASDPKDATDIDETKKQTPVEVNDWNDLMQHAQILSKGSDKQMKICMIDEENEEIRLQNQDEFDLNVQYARDHHIKSLSLFIYIDDKRLFNGIYHIEKLVFPTDKLQMLLDNVLVEKWYIPVKQDESLGVCLTASISLAQNGKLDSNADCKRFIEDIVPEAFRKLQNTDSVLSWPREIQCGIFEMVELLVDLVGTRLCYPPVPVTLLKVLAMTFDTNTKFSEKHKKELLPSQRAYTIKDGDFLRENYDHETYGWLRSMIQRFLAQNGLDRIRLQFECINASNSTTMAKEYNALFELFSKCNKCINAERYRLIFHRPIHLALQYLRKEKSAIEQNHELKELHETLVDICHKYDLKDEVKTLLTLASCANRPDLLPTPAENDLEIIPLIEITPSAPRKTKNYDCYERLAEDIRSMSINGEDPERKNVKKQRTDEQVPITLFTHNLTECIQELLTATEKRSIKRRHRREHQRTNLTSASSSHSNKKESKRSATITLPPLQTYDRTNPEDILRYFAPMKLKVATLYENLHTATCLGNIRDVLKIEEKLKLLGPFSARFIADENMPDGTKMQPGQTFRKGWILFNDGSLPWDSNDIQLVNLSDGIQVVQQPVVPITAPHARAVITADYKCADKPGKYESKWILSYRQQTFGPMIWCSIEVVDKPVVEKPNQAIIDESEFEFVEVPLPACFDLSKPYQSIMQSSSDSSLNTSFILSNVDPTESLPVDFSTVQIDNLKTSFDDDIDTLSIFTYSSAMSPPTAEVVEQPIATNIVSEEAVSLIELAPPVDDQVTTAPKPDNVEEHEPVRPSQPLDFVDTVVTNIFSVAKHAGSTAKAIFNTLQAFDEVSSSVMETPKEKQLKLVNTFEEASPKPTDTFPTEDQMQALIEMGFVNRAKNQRLLRENANDLAKVIQLLTLDSNDDTDWFAHRH